MVIKWPYIAIIAHSDHTTRHPLQAFCLRHSGLGIQAEAYRTTLCVVCSGPEFSAFHYFYYDSYLTGAKLICVETVYMAKGVHLKHPKEDRTVYQGDWFENEADGNASRNKMLQHVRYALSFNLQ